MLHLFLSALDGFQRFDLTSRIMVIQVALRSIGYYVALKTGHGLVLMAEVFVATQILCYMLNFTLNCAASSQLQPRARLRPPLHVSGHPALRPKIVRRQWRHPHAQPGRRPDGGSLYLGKRRRLLSAAYQIPGAGDRRGFAHRHGDALQCRRTQRNRPPRRHHLARHLFQPLLADFVHAARLLPAGLRPGPDPPLVHSRDGGTKRAPAAHLYPLVRFGARRAVQFQLAPVRRQSPRRLCPRPDLRGCVLYRRPVLGRTALRHLGRRLGLRDFDDRGPRNLHSLARLPRPRLLFPLVYERHLRASPVGRNPRGGVLRHSPLKQTGPARP